MDISGGGEPICNLCKAVYMNGYPKTELLCGHFFHTECLIYEWEDHLHCPSCREPMFNEFIRHNIAIRQESREEQRRERVYNTIVFNPELKKDVRNLKKQISNLRKAKKAFLKYGNERKRSFRENTVDMINLLKKRQKDAIREVNTSDEMKQWRSQRAKMSRLVRLFEQKYPECTVRELMKVNALKLPKLWQYRQLMNVYCRYSRFRRWFHIY